MQEKHRQQLPDVFLFIGFISLLVVTGQAYNRGSLDLLSFLAGISVGIAIYAVFFTREKRRRYFPDVLLALCLGFSGLGPLWAMNAGAIKPPIDNPFILILMIIITLCSLYKVSVWKNGYPEPVSQGAKS